MKNSKIVIIFSFLILITSCSQAQSISWCQEKTFTVTAYYSPKSWQVFYYKPSLNDEVILNGEGKIGASWKEVFNGMLAWPSSYQFWSIVYLKWFWFGEIADRWWAIVQSGERWQIYDRIDIRMWDWESWLTRALTFGKKNIKWFICLPWTQWIEKINIWINFDAVPIFKNFFDISLRIQQLQPGRNDIRTRTLQKYLIKLGYLDFKYQNWIYDFHTTKALCNYQIKRKIVSKSNPDCWKFGKKTRYIMKQEVSNKFLLPDNLRETTTFDDIISQAISYNKINNTWNSLIPNLPAGRQGSKFLIPNLFLFYRSYKKWDQNGEIKTLQKFLQWQWVYSGKIDGFYNKKTMDSVYDFQKKYWLISTGDSLALRWYLGPKTREKINELTTK